MKTSGNETHHIVDILFVIALLCFFAVSAMMLIILGANIYKNTVSHMSENFDSRTSYAYIVQKIRQHDEAGAVSAGSFDGKPSIIMTDDVDGISYTTYLYESDGYICELLSRSDQDMNADSGTKIMPVKEFDIEKENDCLYHIKIKNSSGTNVEMYISTHCGTEDEIT